MVHELCFKVSKGQILMRDVSNATVLVVRTNIARARVGCLTKYNANKILGNLKLQTIKCYSQ